MRFLVNRFPIFIVACITALVFVSSGLIFLNLNIRKNIEQSVYTDLKISTEQQAENFSARLSAMTDLLVALSKNIPFTGQINEVPVDFLYSFVKDTEFDSFILLDVNGDSVSHLGRRNNFSKSTLFKKAISGDIVIKGPFFSNVSNARIIAIAVPIIRNGETIGVLNGNFKANKLGSWMLSSFEGRGSVYITDNSGEIIAKACNQNSFLDYGNNLFADLSNNQFANDTDFSQLLQNLAEHKDGYTKYEQADKNYLMYYSQIPERSWYIFSVITDDVVSDFKNSIIAQIYVLSAMIILLSIGFLFWIIRMQINHVRRIEETAFFDNLTGAPTLLKFKLDAQKLLDAKVGSSFVLAKFDIDRFKLINKTFGYAEGDRVIKSVAKALFENGRKTHEKYARVNIDEFVVLYEVDSVASVPELKAEFVNKFFQLMGENFNYNIKFPAGYCLFEGGAERESIADIIEKANIAHRKAKQLGLDLYVYDEEIVRADLARKDIENKMESALLKNEFKVFLQPKYHLYDETIAGAEALVRWKDKYGDILYPNAFIPLFEENGFIMKLDTYIFEEVCKLIKDWMISGLEPVPVSVNFSRNQLNNVDFVDTLCALADKHQVPRNLLEIELTESVIIENEAVLLDVLEKLHSADFRLAMDDFGTGYSSLGMLKNIPVDIIKIDRSFFIADKDDLRGKVVIVHIMEMARELGIVTVAEGIETKEYAEFLKAIKCDIAQGYYYARPMPAEDFTRLLGGVRQWSSPR